jgi:hypothetical protein
VNVTTLGGRTVIATFLSTTLQRNLEILRGQIAAYEQETDLWRRVPGIANPAGNLALHACGNLQYFVGAVLGNSGYVRDRDAEFGAHDVPRHDLLDEIDTTAAAVRSALERMPDETLLSDYPVVVAGNTLKTGDFLVHLVGHLGYHLGQVDYHRRLVAGETHAIATPPMSALHSARPAASGR